MKIRALFVILWAGSIFGSACETENENTYGEPNTISIYINGSFEKFFILRPDYAFAEKIGSIENLQISGDSEDRSKSFTISFQFQGTGKIGPGTFRDDTINTVIARHYYFQENNYHLIYHESGPQSVPPTDLAGLKFEIIMDEFEADQPGPDGKYMIKKFMGRFKSDCREKLQTDIAFVSKILSVEGYINLDRL